MNFTIGHADHITPNDQKETVGSKRGSGHTPFGVLAVVGTLRITPVAQRKKVTMLFQDGIPLLGQRRNGVRFGIFRSESYPLNIRRLRSPGDHDRFHQSKWQFDRAKFRK